jgi:superfamily II DNA helicase RecQ
MLFPTEATSRDDFEDLVGAMAAAGLVRVEDATFEKADRIIPYRKVALTREGYNLNDRTPLELLLAEGTRDREPVKPKRRKPVRDKQPEPLAFSPEEAALEKKLRDWRVAEAKKLGRPAFFVFSDRTLRALVQTRPTTLEELLAIEGIGPAKAEAFGHGILQICRSTSAA